MFSYKTFNYHHNEAGARNNILLLIRQIMMFDHYQDQSLASSTMKTTLSSAIWKDALT